MRIKRTLILALCFLTLAALPSLAQVPEPPEPPAADEPAATDEATAEAEPVLLQLKYEEGESLLYETSVDGVGSVHVMGQAQPIEMTGAMQVTMNVEEIDEDGNYIIVTDVDIAELSVTMSGNPVPPPKQNLQMRATMSPRGEVVDLQMQQEVDQPNSETPWNAEMTKMLTGGFDLNRMVLGQKVAAFPEDVVKPGDQWQGNAPEVQVQGETAPLTITTTYDGNIELDGRTCARLDSSTSLQPAALGELATTLSMEGSTTTDTRTWFDIEAGRMVASMERTQVNMQVKLPTEMTGAQQPAGVFLEMFVNTESNLVPAEEAE